MSQLLKTKILVESNTLPGFSEDDVNSDSVKRVLYQPEYITSCLAKAHIVEFHPNREFPYEIYVTMTNGEVYSVDMEFEEFRKLYEQ